VVVDVAVDRVFDYRIPDRWASEIGVGTRVTVPFGRSRRTGFVVGLAERSGHKALKDIEAPADRATYIDAAMLKLAHWMAAYYLAPTERAIRTVLPGAVRRRGARAKRLLRVERVEGCGAEDPAANGGRGAGPAAPAKPLPPKQQAVLDALDRAGGAMFLADIQGALGITVSPLRALEKKGRIAIREAERQRVPVSRRTVLPTQPHPLMPQQAEALRIIRDACGAGDAMPEAGRAGGSRVVLLHGVTGSGKTEVYLQAIDAVVKQGGGAIVLVPEIALTPQTVERFMGRFGDNIAVLHSHLSDGERYDEWHRIHRGAATVVVGARSAVFAPVRRLGLIVVDEEHETTYKQDEAPRYHARDVAVMRGVTAGCGVVLGSATPSLESWRNACSGKYRLAEMPHRVDHRRMPHIRVVDMRLQKGGGKGRIFSPELLEAIGARLERAEQTILFLNRRGYASALVCPACGFVARCAHCSVALTYHRAGDRLLCHICGAAAAPPTVCPGCGDPAIRQAGLGTQRVEAALRKCFPRARIARMDADSMTRKTAYDEVLGMFRQGKLDVLIGTQMIAKGLHFPNVTLVGVVAADLSLHIPDFRAGERTFQLLAQVAGRAGRGEVFGEVLVQTFTPFHPAIQAARRLDYSGFCDQELAFRRELLYPPFGRLVCVGLHGVSDAKTAYCATLLSRKLRAALGEETRVSEGVPAPLARARGHYRYQVIVRSRAVQTMAHALKAVLRGVKLPKDVAVTVDVDALNLM
jgi:primosomal protein N' (replication factor Y) (superfamily II helicase)